MKKIAITAATLILGAGLGTVALDEPAKEAKADVYVESEWALELVQQKDIFIAEDFVITDENVFEDGDIRGEKLRNTGEGIYYTKEHLEALGVELELGDVVRATWTANDYWNEDWDAIESLVILEDQAFEIEGIE